MKFLNPDEELRKHGDSLPHWQQGEAMQFVTFRLGDALPASLIDEWRTERDNWLLDHPQPWSRETQAEYHVPQELSRSADMLSAAGEATFCRLCSGGFSGQNVRPPTARRTYALRIRVRLSDPSA